MKESYMFFAVAFIMSIAWGYSYRSITGKIKANLRERLRERGVTMTDSNGDTVSIQDVIDIALAKRRLSKLEIIVLVILGVLLVAEAGYLLLK